MRRLAKERKSHDVKEGQKDDERSPTIENKNLEIFFLHINQFHLFQSAICVEVTGGMERPFVISFKPYNPGDAPVRIDNLCEDLFLKLHQEDSGQVRCFTRV